MAEAVGRDLHAAIEIGTGSTDSRMEPNTEIEDKCQYEGMVAALKSMIVKPEPSFAFRCRIKRVPDHLRKVNEQAYSPMVISIGPIHHFDKKLRFMEKFKVVYLKFVLGLDGVELMDLVTAVRGIGESIHCCYAEIADEMDVDYFSNVILVDAIFVLEYIYRKVNVCWKEDDFLIRDQMDFIERDLLLLENQIPFFVLDRLFCRIGRYSSESSLFDLICAFFEPYNVQRMPSISMKKEHFVDLIRGFQLPVTQCLPEGGPVPGRVRRCGVVTLTYSATQLHGAGVKFQVSESKCLLDITFDFRSGVLRLPCLELYEKIEAVVRNVMAFEQYCFREETYIGDYYLFLDRLVNTTKDVDLLCDKGIIRNYLGDNDAVTSLVNKLNVHVFWSGVHPNHNRIFNELNRFYEKRWHKWRATLRRQYCSTPWRVASTSAAIILLVFTFVQTVCSIIQIVPIV